MRFNSAVCQNELESFLAVVNVFYYCNIALFKKEAAELLGQVRTFLQIIRLLQAIARDGKPCAISLIISYSREVNMAIVGFGFALIPLSFRIVIRELA